MVIPRSKYNSKCNALHIGNMLSVVHEAEKCLWKTRRGKTLVIYNLHLFETKRILAKIFSRRCSLSLVSWATVCCYVLESTLVETCYFFMYVFELAVQNDLENYYCLVLFFLTTNITKTLNAILFKSILK